MSDLIAQQLILFLGEKVGDLQEKYDYWDIGIVIFSGYDGSIIKKKNIGSLVKESLLDAKVIDNELVVIAKSNDWSPELNYNVKHEYPQVHFKKFVVDISYDFTHPTTTTTPSPITTTTPSPINTNSLSPDYNSPSSNQNKSPSPSESENFDYNNVNFFVENKTSTPSSDV